MKELARVVTQIEGKRQSVSVAQVSEILGAVADLAHVSGEVLAAIVAAGARRAKRSTVRRRPTAARKRKGARS